MSKIEKIIKGFKSICDINNEEEKSEYSKVSREEYESLRKMVLKMQKDLAVLKEQYHGKK